MASELRYQIPRVGQVSMSASLGEKNSDAPRFVTTQVGRSYTT